MQAILCDKIDALIEQLRHRSLEPAYIVMDTGSFDRLSLEVMMNYSAMSTSSVYRTTYRGIPLVAVLTGESFIQVVPSPEKMVTAPTNLSHAITQTGAGDSPPRIGQ